MPTLASGLPVLVAAVDNLYWMRGCVKSVASGGHHESPTILLYLKSNPLPARTFKKSRQNTTWLEYVDINYFPS